MLFRSFIINFPPVPLNRLAYKDCNIGTILNGYATRKLKIQLNNESIQSLDKLDRYRQTLGTQQEIPIENYQMYAEYIVLLKTLTENVDLSSQGADLKIKWNTFSCPNFVVDFELFCMGYNIVLDLLAKAGRINFSSIIMAKNALQMLGCANGIYSKLMEFHHDEFEDIVRKKDVISLSNYIETFYSHLTVAFTSLTEPPKFNHRVYAKAASNAANNYKNKIASQEMASYFTLVANIQMSLFYMKKGEYGLAIAYGQKALNSVSSKSSKKNLKKDESNVSNKFTTILAQYKPIFDQMDRDNKKIYFQSVPREIEDIPAANAGKCPSTFNFDVQVSVQPFSSVATGGLSNTIQNRINNIDTEINRALKDIDDVMKDYPIETYNQIQNLLSIINSKRDMVRNDISSVSLIIEQNREIVNKRFPNAFPSYQMYYSKFQAGQQTDVEYETRYAKIKSLLDQPTQLYNALFELKNIISDYQKRAHQIVFDLTSSLSGQTNTSCIATIQRNADTEFDGLANEINPLLKQVADAVVPLRDAKVKIYPYYLSESMSIVNGFNQGVEFYTAMHDGIQNSLLIPFQSL